MHITELGAVGANIDVDEIIEKRLDSQEVNSYSVQLLELGADPNRLVPHFWGDEITKYCSELLEAGADPNVMLSR